MKKILIRTHLQFLLNDREIILDEVPASLTLLDYIRLDQHLTGTKEGCAEGDCGACTVLVGRLSNDTLVYETINSCIRLMGSLDGCHVVTVEYLTGRDGSLHPVQQAMVDYHGSQCGFCTPGFVMSLYALWMENPSPSMSDIERSLQGNLCRCTGYAPIVRAARAASAIPATNDRLMSARALIKAKLLEMSDGTRVEIRTGDDLVILPASISDLADLRVHYPNATLIAGATDVGLWVTKFMRPISPVLFLSHLDDLRQIHVSEEKITLGAGVSYQEMSALITDYLPQLADYWGRIGGTQVRNAGTIGGNIANGSPIGDTPPVLITLGASIVMRRGDDRRIVLLEDFFIDYGKQDRQEGDFVEMLTIPRPNPSDHIAAYKVSKRRDEDISAVCCGIRLRLDGNIVSDITLAFGGMAAIPKRAKNVEAALIGKSWNDDTIKHAQEAFDDDFTPLSDWRASAGYRLLVAKNLLYRFYLETKGNRARLNRDLPHQEDA